MIQAKQAEFLKKGNHQYLPQLSIQDFDILQAIQLTNNQGQSKSVQQQLKDFENQFFIQQQNIFQLKESVMYYRSRTKLSHNTKLITAFELFPRIKPGEEIWPTAADLEPLDKEQLMHLKISSLRIIQKNSSRSRGDEWGHAFYFQLRMDQGIVSPLIGQDEWEHNHRQRPELSDYNMRDLTKIVVSKKDEMVNAIFFFVAGQENYKNVLASAECFALINYEQLLRDPVSKGCTLKSHEIKKGQRWAGVKYSQRNQAPASRYFSHFEPIIIGDPE